MSGKFITLYGEKLKNGDIDDDPAQRRAAAALDALEDRLAGYKPLERSFLGGWFTSAKAIDRVPKGLYLYGGVGCGKTMLMDLFFEAVSFSPKARYHFNEFMTFTHDRIGEYRKTEPGDPIPLVAGEIADRARLLCFDEFYVTDIADAMILGRLFTALFEAGVVVVATSNCKISELYPNGLNRQLFLPFIELMQTRMESHHVVSGVDYRLRQLEGEVLYFSPNDIAADEAMCSLWQKVTRVAEGKQATIIVKGRNVIVPEAASGAARFSFDDLCASALGRDDYLAIASRYHTVFLEDIPVMGPQNRNEARRFITLIDTLYDAGVRLIATAAAEPVGLYRAGDNATLFERTTSRLIEMRTGSHMEPTETA